MLRRRNSVFSRLPALRLAVVLVVFPALSACDPSGLTYGFQITLDPEKTMEDNAY